MSEINTIGRHIEDIAMERIQNITRAHAAGKFDMERAWGKISKIVASTNALLDARSIEKVLDSEVGDAERQLRELTEKRKAAQKASEIAANNFELHLTDE